MNSPTSSVVNRLKVLQYEPVFVPDPVSRKDVDESVEEGKHHIAQEVCPLCDCTRHYCGGGGCETGLEEEMGVFIAHGVRVVSIREEIAQSHQSEERGMAKTDGGTVSFFSMVDEPILN